MDANTINFEVNTVGWLNGGTATAGFMSQLSPSWNFCPNCARKLEASWNFCTGCGQALKSVGFIPPWTGAPAYPMPGNVWISGQTSGANEQPCLAEQLGKMYPGQALNIACPCPKCSPRCQA